MVNTTRDRATGNREGTQDLRVKRLPGLMMNNFARLRLGFPFRDFGTGNLKLQSFTHSTSLLL